MSDTQFSDEAPPAATVVGGFASDEAAEAAASSLRAAGLADEVRRCRRLVFALLAGTPVDRLAVLEAALRKHTLDVLVEYGSEERAVTLFGRCRAPDAQAAFALADTLTTYFNTPYYLNVRAPWERASLPPDQIVRDERVQATVNTLNTMWETVMQNLVQQFGGQVLDPQNVLDPARLQTLGQQMQEAQQQLYTQGLARLAQKHDLDPTTLALLGRLSSAFGGLDAAADPAANLAGIQEVTGQHRPTLLSGIGGQITAAGRTLTLDFVMFHCTAFGLPALVDYLGEQGCTDFDLRLEDFDDVRGD